MAARRVVAIGASAGGIPVIAEILGRLPADFPAAVLVVVHIPPYRDSQLANILSRAGPISATQAEHGEGLVEGHIYVAPSNYHLVVRGSRLELDRGPRENRTRPAIDPLFRSVARSFRHNAAGVILSGMQGDGTVGLMAINAYGGLTIVQDPDETQYQAMPTRAIRYGNVDHVLRVTDIPYVLEDFVSRSYVPIDNGTGMEAEDLMKRDFAAQVSGKLNGHLTLLSCPSCGGALWQTGSGESLDFHCHVGHSYSEKVLLAEKSEALESALWAAVRTLVENATLKRQLAERFRSAGMIGQADAVEEQAMMDDEHMEIIRNVILGAIPPSAQEVEELSRVQSEPTA